MSTKGSYGKQRDKIKKVANIWEPHNDVNCQVSSLYQEQATGGKPRKKERKGRVKLLFNDNDSDIFSTKFTDNIADSKITNCESALPDNQNNAFMCGICSDLLPMRSVTTGCHCFCSRCLSDVFKISHQNKIMCPSCNENVQYGDVEGTDAAFRIILSDLPVKCCCCNKVDDYYNMITHTSCSPVKQTVSSEIAIQTTPSAGNVSISLNRSLTSPLSKEEEHVLFSRLGRLYRSSSSQAVTPAKELKSRVSPLASLKGGGHCEWCHGVGLRPEWQTLAGSEQIYRPSEAKVRPHFQCRAPIEQQS